MAKKIFPGELIGEEIAIITTTNPAYAGIKGKVVNETKSTIQVEQQGKIKTLLKQAITFKLGDLVIVGSDLVKRPEDRIKGK